ncbi:hypothetical protein BJX99DRAFT_220301 [Aspergillus californicus]
MPDSVAPRPREDAWREMRKGFLVAVAISFLLLQVLFLGNMCYLYATQYQDTSRIHNLNLLFVDYDGGVIGQSVLDGYQMLRGSSFPSLEQSPVADYPDYEDVKGAVCKGDYWGAIYAHQGASANLESALSGENASMVSLGYVWNGARYPAFAQSAIYSNLLTLVQVTRSAYYARNATDVIASAPLTNPNSLQAFLDPIQSREINIKVTEQGPRVLYNTVSIVMPIIQQFFFMMALNGISAQFKLFTKLSSTNNGLLRMCVSLAYTFIAALCMVGYVWAFKESWDVNSNQFALCWMAIWLYMHINFLIVDILTSYVPMHFMPFCVLTWVVLNVASTISPFELSPGFFRWGYVLPSHELYQVLVQIWSDGCDNQLYRALPIMFSWWIAGLGTVVVAMRHRCRVALAAEKATTEANNDRETSLSSRPSSSQAILQRQRRNTIELERVAYGPSYPTPLVTDNK